MSDMVVFVLLSAFGGFLAVMLLGAYQRMHA